ncbi:hypothetical protein EU537_10820 [Candidatus Thorarchaeota archaeon]|nr:MAG: hypothetical protein EU537_10820 [Candidatus Thorarchaeota archaeon]
MTGKGFFSTRLTSDNVDLWNLLQEDEKTKNTRVLKAFAHFCQMDRSMLFASYLGDELIGLAAVYLAKEDKSAMIAGIKVHQEYRESSTRQVIRSSLPLFRTTNIQSVVAAVAEVKETIADYFPFTGYLQSWSREALEDLGFRPIGAVNYCRIENISKSIIISSSKKSDYSHSQGMELIRRIRKQGERVPSTVLLGLDLGESTKHSVISSTDDAISMLLTYVNIGNEIVFPVFLAEAGMAANEVSKCFKLSPNKSNIDALIFPSIRQSQVTIMEELAAKLEGELVVNSLALMQKNL